VKPHRSIVALASRLVPKSLRDEWRQEWDAELDHRETTVAAWSRTPRRASWRLLRESSGAVWDALWLRSSRWQSVRFLLRYWRITAPAIVSLGVALAAAIAAAGLYEALLLRPPGVADPSRLLTMYVKSPVEEYDGSSMDDLRYYAEHSRGFAGWTAFSGGISLLTASDLKERLVGMAVAENYFDVLGVEPALGSLRFPRGAGSTDRSVVLSEALWRRLGADPGIVGREFRLGAVVLRVLGVAPEAFRGMSLVWRTDVWFPVSAASRIGGLPDSPPDRTDRGMILLARLKADTTRASAGAEVAALSGELAAAYPATDAGRRAFLVETSSVPPDDRLWVAPMLGAVVGVALLTLTVAAANTVSLLLSLAISRRHEMLVRSALGASKLQLMLPLLREGVSLGAAAGLVGLPLASAALVALSHAALPLGPDLPPAMFFVQPDLPLLGCAAVLVVAAGIMIGLVPAWRAASDGLSGALTREMSRRGARGGRTRGALIIAQVAVASIVLAGVGIAWRSVINLRHADLGFSARHLMSAPVPLDMGGYSETTGRQFYGRLKAAVAAVPGVTAVGLSSGLPIETCCPRAIVRTDVGARNDANGKSVMFLVVDDHYFSMLGVPIVAGRTFDERDAPAGTAAVVVNELLARADWPAGDAIGRRLRITNGGDSVVATVVGVVADGKYSDLDEAPEPFLFYSLRQNYVSDPIVLAATTSDSPALKRAIHDTITSLDPRLDIWAVRSLTDALDLELVMPKLILKGIAGLATLAILLAAVGLYGTVLHAVGQRRTEIGIRVALGAQPRHLMGLVLRRVLGFGLAGALIGVALTMAIQPALSSVFYGLKPVEAGLLAAALGLSLALCLAVGYLAARPWTRISAIEILRQS